MHHIVERPAHISGTIRSGIIILIPSAERIIAVFLILCLEIIIDILLLKEIDPALRQTDGHRLICRTGILPVPGPAVDIQRRTHRFQCSRQKVLQRFKTRRSADRSAIRLRHKSETYRLSVNPNRLSRFKIFCRYSENLRRSCTLIRYLIDFCKRKGFSSHRHMIFAGGCSLSLSICFR